MAEDPKTNRGGQSVRTTGGPAAAGGREQRSRPDRVPREPSPDNGAAARVEGAEAERAPRREGDRGPRPEGDRGPRPGGDRRGARPERRDDRRGPGRDDRRDDHRNDSASPLTASLFSAVQDKQVPCRIAGCGHTWTWFAAQQIRGFGQPPPDRMCDEHLAQFNELADREVTCRTPGCANTWTWKRGAQLAEMQRTGKLRRPARLCAACFSAERETQDAELPCKIDGCRRSWTWTRDAQLRHRLWLLRQRSKADQAEARAAAAAAARLDAAVEQAAQLESAEPVAQAESAEPVAQVVSFAEEVRTPEVFADTLAEGLVPALPGESPAPAEHAADATPQEESGEPGGDRRKRRRKRRRGGKPVVNAEGPPERMCGLCAQKLMQLQPREQPCKVHGCSRTWTWDRTSQMRAWVASGSDDLDFEPGAPRRMCEVCREFCRTHSDREVACGRPECNQTWMYKTGAQLQAFLAGRLADPLKLCGECARGEFAASFRPGGEGGEVPEGAETMPCVVPGCEGTWLYIPGMRLRETPYGELAPDRMCGPHRQERGFAVDPAAEAAEVEVTAADLEAEDVDDESHDEPHDDEGGDDAGDLAVEDDASDGAAADAPDALELEAPDEAQTDAPETAS